MKKFPFSRQLDAMDCGPACLRMIAAHFGRSYSLESLRDTSFITKEGVNLLGISEAAENIGLRTLAIKVVIDKLIVHAPFPCILHWNQKHFVVLYKVKNDLFYIADPGHGLQILKKDAFLKCWQGSTPEGIALLIEPTERFFAAEIVNEANKGFKFLYHYVKPYKQFVLQLLLSMVVGSGISLILPFLTQSMVDKGINANNLRLIQLILICQIVLFIGTTAIETIRSWLIIHINSRINIAIISDFLMKLMRLPIRYFESKQIGDLKQRISDHNRVQSFLTSDVLSILFSIINLLVFSAVMAIYSLKILLLFLVFTAVSTGWIILFLRRRKQIDYVRFQRMGENENVLFELITGMQETKLNNAERSKRWGWERVQVKLFQLNLKSLVLNQYQQIGSNFFHQFKNIIITYVVAKEVVTGHMTLGMMMSVSYIIGQMNAPIQSFLGFVQSAQDARISLDRLNEIHNKRDEELEHQRKTIDSPTKLDDISSNKSEHKIIDSGSTGRSNLFNSIRVDNVSFQYIGAKSPYVLRNITLDIPTGKVTAIVGASGSGKTTLMKLLLNFYEPTEGRIMVNNTNLSDISPSYWRSRCGVVMSEGYIYSDTIANNIAMADESVDHRKLRTAVVKANIKEFIEELPLTYNSMIGNAGIGVSTGQKQRLLIARAIYKNPDFLFFDEATSALDANNEKKIMENLEGIYEGKTVVVIAHRLSTVKRAHQIVVMENGEIVEIGNHDVLLSQKGRYFELVKNQLELSS